MDFSLIDQFFSSKSALVYLLTGEIGLAFTVGFRTLTDKRWLHWYDLWTFLVWSIFVGMSALIIDTSPAVAFMVGLGCKEFWGSLSKSLVKVGPLLTDTLFRMVDAATRPTVTTNVTTTNNDSNNNNTNHDSSNSNNNTGNNQYNSYYTNNPQFDVYHNTNPQLGSGGNAPIEGNPYIEDIKTPPGFSRNLPPPSPNLPSLPPPKPAPLSSNTNTGVTNPTRPAPAKKRIKQEPKDEEQPS